MAYWGNYRREKGDGAPRCRVQVGRKGEQHRHFEWLERNGSVRG